MKNQLRFVRHPLRRRQVSRWRCLWVAIAAVFAVTGVLCNVNSVLKWRGLLDIQQDYSTANNNDLSSEHPLLFQVIDPIVPVPPIQRQRNGKNEEEMKLKDADVGIVGSRSSPPAPKCHMKIEGNCVEFPSLSNSDWFDDAEKGGPPPSTWINCRLRQASWEKSCQTIVKMDFDGPGALFDSSSLQFRDIDGAILSLEPIPLKKHQSCFKLTTDATPDTPPVSFCYPTINIVGHPKAGTSFFYFILKEHPKIFGAHPNVKEYCRMRTQDNFLTYYEYLKGFEPQTSATGPDDILVNGCIRFSEAIEFDNLLRGPKTLNVYLVRNAAERSWAAYNFWCDHFTESDCPEGGWAKQDVHFRSPESFHDAIISGPTKNLIPNHEFISTLYTVDIHRFESWSMSKHIHVVASEKMKNNLDAVWNDLVRDLSKQTGGFDLSPNPKLLELQGRRINSGFRKGGDVVVAKEGVYAQSNFKPMLEETAHLITSWWDECTEIAERSKWAYYRCPTNLQQWSHLADDSSASLTAYEKFTKRRHLPRTTILPDRYLTLWLHQVHRWFGAEDVRLDNVRAFLNEAMNAGFTSIMTDLPWEWTERDAMNDLNLLSFNKDWMQIACDLGLKLQVVISARDMPPWMKEKQDADDDLYTEMGSPGCDRGRDDTSMLSMAHPFVWERGLNYTKAATTAVLRQYGRQCIVSLSATWNNEFETRYSQSHASPRDYSKSMSNRYKEWQVEKGLSASIEAASDPYPFPCGIQCKAIPTTNKDAWNWLGFREEFLAYKYVELCKAIQESSIGVGVGVSNSDASNPINCFLHFGEMLATASDHLNSNLFFSLARSPHVSELVMDSNVALSGAPANPSVVGLMVSLAQAYSGKVIHYEAATERVVKCDDDGKAVIKKSIVDKLDQGAPLLLRTSILHALEAGIDSLGVTNLCQPNLTATFTPSSNDNKESASNSLATVERSASFEPTAVLFVPYRAFYAVSTVTTGIHCNIPATTCWHPSLAEIPVFGYAYASKSSIAAGTCPVDAFQSAVLQAWDDLRLRHAHVAVYGDVETLRDQASSVVAQATERVIVRLPCLMDNLSWQFYNGDADLMVFQSVARQHPFEEYIANNVC